LSHFLLFLEKEAKSTGCQVEITLFLFPGKKRLVIEALVTTASSSFTWKGSEKSYSASLFHCDDVATQPQAEPHSSINRCTQENPRFCPTLTAIGLTTSSFPGKKQRC
jgi:hypothetical protein